MKTSVSIGEKVPVSNSEQAPASPDVTAVTMPPMNQSFDHQPTTCWYVWGILSTIFCCFPCGVIGLVHAMIAKHEGERGNFAAHRRRLYQAKCWTSWSIALGLLVLLAMVGYAVWFWSWAGYGRAYAYDW